MSKFDCLPHTRIETKHTDGESNGVLIPIFNVNEPWYAGNPAQVYLTTVLPGKCKGPHLHHRRNGAFTCIRGNVKIVLMCDGEYKECLSGEDHGYATVFVPVGKPSMLINIGDVEAFVLNMPAYAYCKKDNDELVPEDWDYEQV